MALFTRDFFRLYLQTNLLLLMGVFGLLFAFWGILWRIAHAYFMSDHVMAYFVAFEPVNFIIGFVYWNWQVRFRDDYNAEPVRFVTMVRAVERLHVELFTFLSAACDERTRVRAGEFARAAQSVMCTVLDSTFAHFLRNSETPVDMRLEPMRAKWCPEPVRGTARGEKLDPISALDMSLTLLSYELAVGEREQLVHPEQFKQLWHHVDTLKTIVDDAHRAQHLARPPYFDNHTSFILIVYFFIVLPVQMVMRSGTAATVAYPLLMLMLTGYSIIRVWLGEPLDANSAWHTIDYGEWKRGVDHQFEERFANFCQFAADDGKNPGTRALRISPDTGTYVPRRAPPVEPEQGIFVVPNAAVSTAAGARHRAVWP